MREREREGRGRGRATSTLGKLRFSESEAAAGTHLGEEDLPQRYPLFLPGRLFTLLFPPPFIDPPPTTELLLQSQQQHQHATISSSQHQHQQQQQRRQQSTSPIIPQWLPGHQAGTTASIGRFSTTHCVTQPVVGDARPFSLELGRKRTLEAADAPLGVRTNIRCNGHECGGARASRGCTERSVLARVAWLHRHASAAAGLPPGRVVARLGDASS